MPHNESAHVVLPPARGRIVQLDALRGVAAVWVMLYHYTIQYAGDYGHGPGVWRVPQGPRAVELFFMISGFVIPMTLGRTKRMSDFVVSRFSRLFPAFWVCLAITASVVALANWRGNVATGWDVAANVSMVPQLIFHRAYVDRSYWTLEVELLFYVATGLAWALGGMRGVTIAIAGLTAASLAEGLTQSLAPDLLRGPIGGGPRGVFDSYFLMSFIAYFACGYASFGLRERGINAASVALLLLAWTTVAARAEDGAPISVRATALATTVVLNVFVTAAAFNAVPLLSAKVLLYLGAISYPLYLLHQDIGYVVIDGGYALNWGPNVCIAVAVGIAVAGGSAVSFAAERPAMRWIRGYARRQNAA